VTFLSFLLFSVILSLDELIKAFNLNFNQVSATGKITRKVKLFFSVNMYGERLSRKFRMHSFVK